MLPAWLQWLRHPTVLLVIGIGSAFLAVVSLLGLPFLLARIPADHFSKLPVSARPGTLRWFGRVLKNLLATLLLLAGIAMLVLPGQGVLTMVIALLLLEFPGKRRLENWLLRRPRVIGAVNALRARAGRSPLELEPPSHSTQPRRDHD